MVKSILGRQTNFKSHGGIKYYDLNEIETISNLMLITHKARGVIVTTADDVCRVQAGGKPPVCLERAQTRAIKGS